MPIKKVAGVSIETKVAVIDEKIDNITEGVKQINTKLEKDYVTNDRFEPVRNIVYGLVFIILTSVIAAILSVIINLKK